MRIADQKRADFVKRFRSLSRRFPLWQVWSDFITMFAIALSNAVDSRYRTEREAMYKRIIEKYEKTERVVFPELVEDVVNAFDADREQDFLGSAYMELELGNHWIGQFFTPYDICRCMAEITTGDVVEQINRDGFVTLNDCACGAGATLIAAVNQIEKQLFEAKSPLRWQNHVLVTAQDLDFTTGMMSALAAGLRGLHQDRQHLDRPHARRRRPYGLLVHARLLFVRVAASAYLQEHGQAFQGGGIMDDKKVKYDALDAMWAFVRMGGYQLHPADISSLKDHCEQLRHLLTQKTAGQRRDKREDIDFHELDVITNNIVIGAMVLYMSGSLDALTPKEASHHEKERN